MQIEFVEKTGPRPRLFRREADLIIQDGDRSLVIYEDGWYITDVEPWGMLTPVSSATLKQDYQDAS